jgi:hypothetical protein
LGIGHWALGMEKRQGGGGRQEKDLFIQLILPCSPYPLNLSLLPCSPTPSSAQSPVPKLATRPFFPQLLLFALVGQLSVAPDYRYRVWGYLEKKAAGLAHPIHQISDR